MHAFTLPKAAALLALVALVGLPSPGRADTFPPLNSPSTSEKHPGKFIWAELFTTDTKAAAKFYTGIFPWTADVIEKRGVTYTVLSNGGRPVAGIRLRVKSASTGAARWVPFISTADVNDALKASTKAGGVTRAPCRKFSSLGHLAIATDTDGAPFGLIESITGDPVDDEPGPGGWNWFHLFARDPKASAEFYRAIAPYDVNPDSRKDSGTELILSSGGFNRAGISTVPADEGSKPGWLGVVRVANLDETLAKVPGLGGEVSVAPHDAVLGSRFAIVTDPSGGSVGLVEYINNANPANRP